MMKMILLDVDDTLYPKGTGPFARVNARIDGYVMSVCRVDLPAARAVRKTYIQQYGSTMQGLMRDYGIDPGHYLKDVHDVPVENLLARDPELYDALKGLGKELVVFSNGSYEYASRILCALGIETLISDLFTIEYMDFIPKPLAWPYHKAMELYGRKNHEIIAVDDSLANINTALDLGMAGVVIGGKDPTGRAVSVPDIYSISRVVSEYEEHVRIMP
jgi:putative hydrolase of the HAD superfamily